MEEVKVAREELKKYAGKWIGSDDLVNLSLSQKKKRTLQLLRKNYEKAYKRIFEKIHCKSVLTYRKYIASVMKL